MGLTSVVGNIIAAHITGDNSTYAYFNNANAYLGVGDDATAFNGSTQTDLVAATNKLRKAMNATYPTRSTNVLTAQSTFQTGDANWHWQEWGFFNASSGSQMLARQVSDLGTKTSASTWQLTVTITFNIS